MLTYHMVSALKISVSWHSPMLQLVPSLLGFVSGSWVFLSGVIVALYYQPKFTVSPLATTRRLWIRGAKLLLIFVTLNYLVYRLGLKPAAKFDLDILTEILTRGGGYLSSFEILIGIAYVLIAAPIILALRGFGTALLLTLSMIVFTRSILEYSIEPNMWIIMMGFLGILSMQLFEKLGIAKYLGHVHVERILPAILFVFLVTLSFVNWHFHYQKYDLVSYFLTLIAINGFVFVIYPWIKLTAGLDNVLRQLGRHSLIGYLSQMMIIWIVLGIFKKFDLNSNIVIILYFISSISIFLVFMHFYDRAHKYFSLVKKFDDIIFR